MIANFSIKVNGFEMPDITDAALNKNNDMCIITSWTEDGDLVEEIDCSENGAIYDVELIVTRR